MKNAFDRLISRLDTAEDKISELDNKETLEDNRNFQNRKVKIKRLRKITISKNCRTITKGVT